MSGHVIFGRGAARAHAAALVLVSAFVSSRAFAAVTDCIGDSADGRALCTNPTVRAEQLNACANTGTFTYIDTALNNCYSPRPSSDAEIIADANCFASAMSGCSASLQQAVWPGWSTLGQNTTNGNCWSVTTTMRNGVYTLNYAYITQTEISKDQNGNCTVSGNFSPSIELMRSRTLGCPQGYTESTKPNGDLLCKFIVAPACPECGDPIEVGTGRQTQTEIDYESPGLSFVRSYDSFGSFRPTWAPEQPTKPLGEYWTHNFESRVYPYTGNAYVMAAMLRPNGAIVFFDTQGRDLLAAAPGGRLEAVTDGNNAITGWMYRPRANETEEYDASGKLVRVQRPGFAATLTYSDASTPASVAPAAGMLLAVTDAQGRALQFTYSLKGYLATVTAPGGLTYRYDMTAQIGAAPNRNVAKVTYPGGTSRTYAYGTTGEGANTSGATLPNALTGIVDELGNRFATFKYTAAGKAVEATHALGAEKMDFAAIDALNVNVVNALGYTQKYTFQNDGALHNSSITRPCIGVGCTGSTTATMTYDTNGNVATRTDWNGHTTKYEYDLARNLLTKRVDAFGTSEQRTTSAAWHAVWPLPTKVAEPGRITTYVYNGDGGVTCGTLADGTTLVPGVLCARSVQATTDATGDAGLAATTTGTPRTWSFTYNANGRVLSVDGPRTDVSDVTTFTYYADDDSDALRRGYLKTITDALGHVTTIAAYDAFGAPSAVTDPNGTAIGVTVDARHRVTARSFGGLTTSYSYDAAGNVTQLVQPDGAYLTLSYDAAHRLTGFADATGNRMAYALDTLGNVTQEQLLDSSSNVLQSRASTYDALGRLVQRTGGAGQVTTYTYDGNQNIVKRVDPLGRATAYAYDALDRLTSFSPAGAVTYAFGYDARDNVVSVQTPRGLATTYVYGAFDELLSTTSPEAGTTTYAYDEAGNVKSQTDAKGQTTTFVYDALGRPTELQYADGSKATLKYDEGTNGIGRLTTIADATSGTSYKYDALGRVIEQTTTYPSTFSTVSLTASFEYDAAGHMAAITYPSGKKVKYAYDALGRVSKAQLASGASSTTLADLISYRPFGAFKSFLPATSAPVARTFDNDGRIASYTAAGKTWKLTYDAASRITQIANAANAADARTFAYDALDRLVQAVTPAGSEAMTYDDAGNRLTHDVGGSSQTLTYATDSNRLLQTSAPNARTYTYDANGSPTSDGTNQFAYDARGRLVAVTRANMTAKYHVDPLGRRVAKEVVQ